MFLRPFRSALLLLATAATTLATTEEIFDKKLPVTPGGKLVVEVDFGTIDVATSDAAEVAIYATRKVSGISEAKEREYLDAAPITFTKEGNTVTVSARREKKNSGFSWSWGGNWNTQARYTLKVPATFNVKLDTSGGSISVSDLTGETKADTSGGSLKFTKLRGPLTGDTSGGSIAVTECEGTIKVDTSGGRIEVTGGSGTLTGDTSGGSITVRGFGGDAKVETSGGSVTFENVRGKINGSTSGGSIHATLPSPVPGDVELETSAGSIELRVPANAALTIDAETSVGRVSSELAIAADGKERSALRGSLNGGGKTVRLRTSMGSIRLRQSTPETVQR